MLNYVGNNGICDHSWLSQNTLATTYITTIQNALEFTYNATKLHRTALATTQNTSTQECTASKTALMYVIFTKDVMFRQYSL